METIYGMAEARDKDVSRRQHQSSAFSRTRALASLPRSDFQACQKLESIYLPMMYTKLREKRTKREHI
ncbi:hypothetical protein PsorP6_011508 [Peronosclerospora sorghi]|uniref:Uncharacterized protein n=1 Tax=Peronosclerospora sorghi TaxID=230839 RepID=A0ACC0WHW4_9STRA|nr:hypothetical protein PsorP6_011508 [Peronosclerospora sorghi]